MDALVSTRQKVRLFGVEYNLTEHCNLSCYHCDHASPLMARKFASLEDYERDIRAITEAVHVQEFRLVGGEPLLHPQLLDFIRIARDADIGDAIKIYTNGVLLHTMPEEFWQAIDILQISRYPGVRLRMSEEEIRARCEEHGIELEFCPVMDVFQMRLLNDPIDDAKLVRSIFHECHIANAWGCFSLYRGMFFRCSVAPFIAPRLALAGKQGPPLEADGVPVLGNPNLRAELAECMTTRTPLAACNHCLGTSGPDMAHRQMSRSDGEAWLAEDHAEQVAFARRRVRLQHIGRLTNSAVRQVMNHAPQPVRKALVSARNRVFQYKI